jgi:Domain of unknown function (DUF3854)/Domain of unknown function (DUF927)
MVISLDARNSGVMAASREVATSTPHPPVGSFLDLPLAPQHIDVLVKRGISPETASARAAFTASTKTKLAELGFGPQQRLVPGLVIPIRNTLGEVVNYQLRPDTPRVVRGKVVKYETVSGTAVALDVPPASRVYLRDSAIALLITEGPLKADAAVSHELCCIALLGVWNFRGTEALADWDNIVLKGRNVYIAFDSDAISNPQVYKALARLKGFLELRGADVQIICLPPGQDGSKVGLDDYLAAGHTAEELGTLVEKFLPSAPDDDHSITVGQYRQSPHGISYLKPTQHGDIEVPLTNFPAHISADIMLDAGNGELHHEYEIEAMVKGKHQLLRIPSASFPSMNWVSDLGVGAIVYAGASAKDHARVAILETSHDAAERHVYTHTGWTCIEDQWTFVSSSGGISASGHVALIEVLLQGQLARYDLPSPTTGESIISAVRTSLGLLDLAPDHVMVPLMAAAYRAPLGKADFGIHVFGETGVAKTEIVALIQQHFGREMDALHLPGSWSSTENALEAQLHAAKDAVLVVDDFILHGSQTDVARLQKTADRVFRSLANQTGRQRMRADGTLATVLIPRGFILSTGEERPRGQSLAARRIDLEVERGAIDWHYLTECQQEAATGTYSQAMAGYIQWLADRYDELQAQFQHDVDELRDQVASTVQHRRTPTAIAQLALGWRNYLAFAEDVGAISPQEREQLWNRVWSSLQQVATTQVEHQREVDPVIRALDLIRSAINGGHAHVAGVDGDESEDPQAWGWRSHVVNQDGDTEWRPQGTRIGWTEGDDLYLDMTSTYGVIQRLATSSGNPLLMELQTLKKRFAQQGMLLTTDPKRNRLEVRRTVEGKRISVLHLHRDTIFPRESSQVSHAAQLELRPGDMPFDIEPEPDLWNDERPRADTHFGDTPTTLVALSPTTGTGGPVGTSDLKQPGELDAVAVAAIPPAQLPCRYEDHKRIWVGQDGQYICCVCHPHPTFSVEQHANRARPP